MRFGSLRALAYDCSYQINRCILSPWTLLARNCSQSWPNHHVAIMSGRLILFPPPTPPRGSTSNPPSPAQNQAITFYQQQQGAAKTTTPAICGRMTQLVEAIGVKQYGIIDWYTDSKLSQQRSIVIIMLSASCFRGFKRNTRVF